MQPQEQQAVLTIALLAAVADDATDEREREEIKRIAQSLDSEHGVQQLAQICQDVLLKRTDVTAAAAVLTDPEHRRLAYEMAVCVCDADGTSNATEQQFLQSLRTALRLDATQTATVERDAATLAALPLSPATATSTTSTSATASTRSDSDLDKYILNHAILTGALELLPQSFASMAIIPLQIKMVYRIGQAFGHDLDKGHIKEFIATVGVSLTSQYLEQVGRKLLGGLLGTIAGGLGRGLGSAATGIALSFSTTYALGQLAKRYYAGGRQMNTEVLRSTYQSLLGEARQLQGQNLAQIQQKARTINVSEIVELVKGA
ncbi:MAG TPA: DUF533 domain-containing protein [Steroidobacteraceae bacterium]|jgi:uncharacterized protein (DUF697 family)/tellurite resistance protein